MKHHEYFQAHARNRDRLVRLGLDPKPFRLLPPTSKEWQLVEQLDHMTWTIDLHRSTDKTYDR